MKRKILTFIIAFATALTMTACGGTDSAGQIEAPYLGYAPMTEDLLRICDTYDFAADGMLTSQLCQYDTGEDYNYAVVRLEKADKSGDWQTVQEAKLNLTGNVEKGYMLIRGDNEQGIGIFTEPIETVNTTHANYAKLKPFNIDEVYSCSYFGDFNGREDLSEEELLADENRMDMSSKKAIIMFYSEETPLEMNGEPVSEPGDDDPVVEANINGVYENADGVWDDVYKQGLYAVTMEFGYDEILANAPCLFVENGKLMYEAGAQDGALITLEQSTKDGECECADEGFVSFNNSNSRGELKIDAGNGKVVTEVGEYKIDGESHEQKVEFVVSEDALKTKELTGIIKMKVDHPYGLVLFGDESGKTEAFTANQFFKNKDGKFNDMYKNGTYYVLTMQFVN